MRPPRTRSTDPAVRWPGCRLTAVSSVSGASHARARSAVAKLAIPGRPGFRRTTLPRCPRHDTACPCPSEPGMREAVRQTVQRSLVVCREELCEHARKLHLVDRRPAPGPLPPQPVRQRDPPVHDPATPRLHPRARPRRPCASSPRSTTTRTGSRSRSPRPTGRPFYNTSHYSLRQPAGRRRRARGQPHRLRRPVLRRRRRVRVLRLQEGDPRPGEGRSAARDRQGVRSRRPAPRRGVERRHGRRLRVHHPQVRRGRQRDLR